jgi:hypothetical protein
MALLYPGICWLARRGCAGLICIRGATVRGSGRGPLLEFNEGAHPGDSTRYVNAKDMLSLSLLQARLIDLKMPIQIVEGA